MLGDLLSGASYILDTPGSLLRGLLSGRPGERVSGQEMLGLDDSVGGTAGGILADVLTDPLTYLGGLGLLKGAKVLRGGRAAAPIASAVEEAAPIARTAMAEAVPAESALAKVLGKQAVTETAPVESALAKALGAEIATEIPAVAAPLENARPFYSRLEKAIMEGPESMKAQSVMPYLKKKGITDEELQWTKIGDALEGKQTVSKSELAKHFDENRIGVNEIVKDEATAAKAIREAGDGLAGNQAWDQTNPRFSEYSTPGGENYRELLLTLPQGKHETLETGEKIFRASPKDARFQGQHWDEPNVMAHVRFNERVKDGKKILHIEEIQSDWHQAGKKEGYRSTSSEPLNKQLNALQDQYEVASPEKKLVIQREMQSIQKQIDMPPDAPFKDNWHELSMKRMIRWAAENDFDKITWNTGDQIQKLVGGEIAGQRAFYDQKLPNWLNKYAKQWGVKVEPDVIGGAVPVHSLPVPPKMREDVLFKGQPLMSIGAGGGALLAALMGGQNA